MENIVGTLLRNLRTRKKISQAQLCCGLCSSAVMSRYEVGERVPDIITLNVLFERLGESADQIGIYISQNEYEYMLLRREAINCVEQKYIEPTKKIVEILENTKYIINENLQKQFILLLKAFVAKMEGQEDGAIALLKDAVQITLPAFEWRHLENVLLGVNEVQLLQILAETYLKKEDWNAAENILSVLEKYIIEHYTDENSQVKVYPKTIRLYANILIKKRRYLECMVLCEKAIRMLREQGILYDLAELMEDYAICAEHGFHTEKEQMYRVWVRVLRESYAEVGAAKKMLYSWRYFRKQEICLMHEMLRQCRRQQKLTQERASEGICTQETLSRLESGRRTPRREHFQELMAKYKKGADGFGIPLTSLGLEGLNLSNKLERMMMRQNWAEAEKELDTLQNALCKEKIELDLYSYNVIMLNRACIHYNLGKLPVEEFVEICEKVLSCGKNEWKQENFWKVTSNRNDVEALKFLAMICWKKNELKSSAYIWEHMLTWMKESSLQYQDHYTLSVAVMEHLSYSRDINEKYAECLKFSESGIKLCISTGCGDYYARFFGNRADAMEKQYGKSASTRNNIYRAMIISDIFFQNKASRYYKACLEI